MPKFPFYLLLILTVFFSCKNEEGEGGSSTIRGTVYKIIHSDNNYSLTTDTVPASKEDVFITYGNDDFYGDDVKTDENGFYKFRYLVDGNYKLFAYNSFPDGTKEAVSASVSVGKHKTAQADTLYIHTGDAYGTSIVKGLVNVKYYKKGDYEGTSPGIGQRVFICNSGENIPFDDVRTGINGIFGFEKLKPGTYDIFVINQDPDTEIESIFKQSIEVTETNTIYNLHQAFTINVAV